MAATHTSMSSKQMHTHKSQKPQLVLETGAQTCIFQKAAAKAEGLNQRDGLVCIVKIHAHRPNGSTNTHNFHLDNSSGDAESVKESI